MNYSDRRHAGEVLAERLTGYAGRPGAVVLGLVRGGVPVAAAIADRLGLPLDALVVRKLGVPWAPEVAFGAVGPRDVRVLNDDIAARLSATAMAAVVRHETAELARRERRYRAGRPKLRLTDRVVILVDDGLATGATARAAITVAGKLGAARVVLAVPVGATDAVTALSKLADEVVCPEMPDDFAAVSRFYDDFAQVSDGRVVALLRGRG